MFNQHPFFIETLTQIENNTFRFQQQHFKATCDFLLPLAQVCYLPFEQLIKKQTVHFRDSISECLHHHTLSNMLFDEILKVNRVQILSCPSPRVGVWLVTWPIFPTFLLFSPIFSTLFKMWLKLTYHSILGIPWCVHTHPIDPMGIKSYIAPMLMSA